MIAGADGQLCVAAVDGVDATLLSPARTIDFFAKKDSLLPVEACGPSPVTCDLEFLRAGEEWRNLLRAIVPWPFSSCHVFANRGDEVHAICDDRHADQYLRLRCVRSVSRPETRSVHS